MFDTMIERILSHEGGYVNHPSDPGGETNWGISKRSYPNEDIKNLTRDGAKTIYKKDFWDVIEGDKLPDGIAFQFLDSAVNSGISQSIRFLQRAIGVADDGHFGSVSKKTMSEFSESDVIMGFLSERLEFMTKLSIWDKFGRGWARRIALNLKYGATDS